MNLFDKLTLEALRNQPQLNSLRVVVEKELLHHDILRVLSENNLLKDLVFIGGTCLRCCYGGARLSEDLDFTGGRNFSKDSLLQMGNILVDNLYAKYALPIVVSDPIKEGQNVSTWKIRVETRPQSKHLPAQRINIDICALPSYEKRPMMLINPYGVDMGTSGLIIQAQSREEIYADKLLAFAFRPNRIKYRDLWDIIWLHELGLKPRLELIPEKLKDRNYSVEDFISAFTERQSILVDNKDIGKEFIWEMQRFLPESKMKQVAQNENLLPFMAHLLEDILNQVNA